MTDRMDRHAHDGLNTYGTIYQALGIIAALILAGAALTHFVRVGDAPEVVASANRTAGFAYLAYAMAAVIGGQFLKAVTAWMTAMYANLADLKTKVAQLESHAAQPTTTPTTRPPVPAPLNASHLASSALTPAAAVDVKPARAIRSDDTLTCSSCGHSFATKPSTTWYACPECRVPFAT